MIDIHSHVLPMVDDGSSCKENSLEMLRECVSQGITDIFLTPHHRKPYLHRTSNIEKVFNSFKEEVEQEKLPINLYLGQEIRVQDNLKELLSEQKVLTMNNTKYVLLEFDFNVEQEISEVVYELSRNGYKPIVAHVERYSYVDLDTVFEIKNSGGLIQVNAASLFGLFGLGKAKFVDKLFKNCLVDFVASDIHHRRKAFMEKAYNKVKKKFGEKAAEIVFKLNAQKIIKG